MWLLSDKSNNWGHWLDQVFVNSSTWKHQQDLQSESTTGNDPYVQSNRWEMAWSCLGPYGLCSVAGTTDEQDVTGPEWRPRLHADPHADQGRRPRVELGAYN